MRWWLYNVLKTVFSHAHLLTEFKTKHDSHVNPNVLLLLLALTQHAICKVTYD